MIRKLDSHVRITLAFTAQRIETFNVASMDADVVEVSPYERISDREFAFTVSPVKDSDSVTSVIAEAIPEGSDDTYRWQCAFSTLTDKQDAHATMQWGAKKEVVDPAGNVRIDYNNLEVGGIF